LGVLVLGVLQVGRLYIRYELSVGGNEDSEQDGPLVELEDVVCLLMDDKELYIQKDHLSAKLDICRCVCVRACVCECACVCASPPLENAGQVCPINA